MMNHAAMEQQIMIRTTLVTEITTLYQKHLRKFMLVTDSM